MSEQEGLCRGDSQCTTPVSLKVESMLGKGMLEFSSGVRKGLGLVGGQQQNITVNFYFV